MTDDDAEETLIRSATPADIPAMQAAERRANATFRAVGYDFVADGPIRDEGEHLRVQRDGAAFVAEIGGEVAGFALALPIDGEAHLLEIDVDPAFQKRGIGRRLIGAVEAFARSRTSPAITLTTYRDVAWNAPFYAALGWSTFKPGPERVGLAAVMAEEAAHGFDARPRVAMRKVLHGDRNGSDERRGAPGGP
ncbi:MAG: GNAT family N-acetyltransferase [Parvularculaceae bacterium]|nr:GNAT family N-acetyltransferase [Parvularculaceae bacterium]